MARMMMSIGEFSELTGLSIDTLRHYHDVGVLLPASIDPANGYRRYAVEQVPTARRIAELRQVDVPLARIRQVLVGDTVTATTALLEHRRALVARARAAAALVELVDLLIEKEMAMTDRNDALRDELLAMFSELLRTATALFDETKATRPDRFLFELPPDERPAGYAAHAAQARAFAERLDAIERHGWPGASLVGEDGAAAAWAIAQHADEERDDEAPRSERWLPQLRDAVARGDALPVHYAALCDRVLLRQGSPQRFGTLVEPTSASDGWQLREPVERRDDLDDRRAALGLEPIAGFLAALPSPDAWYAPAG
jgi:DNA-binding transcriptional MerR regulator